MVSAAVRTAVALVVFATAVATASPSSAQRSTPTPTPPPRSDGIALEARLLRGWFGPAAPLALEIVVSTTTQAASDLRATVAVYERLRSRSQLRQVVGGRLPRSPLEAVTYRLEDLPRQASQRVTVEQGLESLPAFQGAPDGLYPLAVTLRRSTGPAIETVITAVTLVSQPPDTPLQVLPVVLVAPGPLLGPDGLSTPRTGAQLAALRRGLASIGEERTYALAVSPLVLDELQSLRAGPLQTRADQVGQALRSAAVGAEVLTMPYTYIRTGHTADLPDGSGLREELAEGVAVLQRGLGTAPEDILFPPGLELDDRTLASLDSLGLRAALVSGNSVPPGTRGLTPADPGVARDVVLLPADELLSRTIAAIDVELDISIALADIAMVHFESPARLRVLTVVMDASSAPVGEILAGLRDMPSVRLVTPTQTLSAPWRRLRNLELASAPRIPRSFEESMTNARTAVGRLAAFTMDGNAALSRLRTALRVSMSTAWWEQDWTLGATWNRGIVRAVDAERRLISTAASVPVTFTSRRGRVPITVVNRAGYPVRVRVELESSRLRFPEGASRVLEPLNPPGELVMFEALTDASGTFPLTVRITSPDGSVLVAEEELIVRSTALNLVAVALTAGAALFILGWSSRRLVRRKRVPQPGG